MQSRAVGEDRINELFENHSGAQHCGSKPLPVPRSQGSLLLSGGFGFFSSLVPALQSWQLVWACSFSAAEFRLWAEVRSPRIILKGKEKHHTLFYVAFR